MGGEDPGRGFTGPAGESAMKAVWGPSRFKSMAVVGVGT